MNNYEIELMQEQEDKIKLQQMEIESLTQKLDRSEFKKEEAQMLAGIHEENFNDARDRGNKAIHDLEISEYWTAFYVSALVLYGTAITIIHLNS
jgi:hypothetical protein